MRSPMVRLRFALLAACLATGALGFTIPPHQGKVGATQAKTSSLRFNDQRPLHRGALAEASPEPAKDAAFWPLVVGALLGLLVAVAGPGQAAMASVAGVTWGYKDTKETPKGTKDWENLFPMCTGYMQSPININTKGMTGKPRGSIQKRLNYVPLTGQTVFNNGGKNIQVNGGFGTLRLPDGAYDVKQFHFHFPAEHTINNVKPAAGELHIVHQKQGEEGIKGLAVVGIVLEAAPDDIPESLEIDFLRQMGFGTKKGLPGKGQKYVVNEPMDLNAFGSEFAGGYWHYIGSLTTPPCSEKVHWYLMKRTARIPKSWIKDWEVVFEENNRPVQDMGMRPVVQSDVAVPGEF